MTDKRFGYTIVGVVEVAVSKRKPTTDAVKIFFDRYIGDDPERLKALEEAREEADREQEEYNRTGIDPYK